MENLQGEQLIVDLYGCNFDIINSKEEIQKIIHVICKKINTNIVSENYHVFNPIGITGFAIISTSHISIHTWPEYNYVAVDIFSCKEGLPMVIAEQLKELLQAKHYISNTIIRKIVNEELLTID